MPRANSSTQTGLTAPCVSVLIGARCLRDDKKHDGHRCIRAMRTACMRVTFASLAYAVYFESHRLVPLVVPAANLLLLRASLR